MVLATGTDSYYGNYIVVICFDVEGMENEIANYFHFASVAVKPGQLINKDVRLGVMGKTGTYATGMHLHTEMRWYTPGQEKLLSPFGTNVFKKDLSAGWFDPLSVTYRKASAPDFQTYATTGDAYINVCDKSIDTVD